MLRHNPQRFSLYFWTVISFLLLSVFRGLIYYLDTFISRLPPSHFEASCCLQRHRTARWTEQCTRLFDTVLCQHCFWWRVRQGYGKHQCLFIPPFLFKMATSHVLWVYSKLSMFWFSFSGKTYGRSSCCINCHCWQLMHCWVSMHRGGHWK